MAQGDIHMPSQMIQATFATTLAVVLIIGADSNSAAAAAFKNCPDSIFAFGNSYTDTGNSQEELPIFFSLNPPYGISYRFPDRPNERTRFCDGRIAIDFITQAFRFPFIEPFERHFNESAYHKGVNFAYSGATAATTNALVPGFFLQREVDEYTKFTVKYPALQKLSGTALYIIPELGGNDLFYAALLGKTPAEAIATTVPDAIAALGLNLKTLIAAGAKNFALFNAPPGGCLPIFLTLFQWRSPILDECGCLAEYNGAARAYNAELNTTIEQLQQAFPQTTFRLLDFYAAFYEILKNVEHYGFTEEQKLKACCGYGGKYNFNLLVTCGRAGVAIDPTTFVPAFVNVSEPCLEPMRYMVWDGMHPTQALYRVISTFFLTGRFVDTYPRGTLSLTQVCELDSSHFWKGGVHQ